MVKNQPTGAASVNIPAFWQKLLLAYKRLMSYPIQ